MIVGIRDDNLFAAANAEPVRGIEVGRADSQLAELAPEVTRKKKSLRSRPKLKQSDSVCMFPSLFLYNFNFHQLGTRN